MEVSGRLCYGVRVELQWMMEPSKTRARPIESRQRNRQTDGQQGWMDVLVEKQTAI